MLRLLILMAGLSLNTILIWFNVNLYQRPLDTKPIKAGQPAQKANNGAINRAGQETDQSVNRTEPTIAVHTLSRPLFDATRRPFVPPPKKPEIVIPQAPVESKAPPPKPAPLKPPQLELLGVSAAPKASIALVKFEARQARWVKIADKLDGWKVDSISSNAIVLKQLDQSFRFTMFPE